MVWTKRFLLALPFVIGAVLNVLLLVADRFHLRSEHIAGYGFLFGTPWAWLLDRGWFGRFEDMRAPKTEPGRFLKPPRTTRDHGPAKSRETQDVIYDYDEGWPGHSRDSPPEIYSAIFLAGLHYDCSGRAARLKPSPILSPGVLVAAAFYSTAARGGTASLFPFTHYFTPQPYGCKTIWHRTWRVGGG
jgi:hypothetical protein